MRIEGKFSYILFEHLILNLYSFPRYLHYYLSVYNYIFANVLRILFQPLSFLYHVICHAVTVNALSLLKPSNKCYVMLFVLHPIRILLFTKPII